MPSYLERYLAGEHERVWDELVALGAAVREEPLHADALAVARETMRRVRANIEALIPRLVQMGFVFGYDHLIQDTLRKPMSGADWEHYWDILRWAKEQPPVFLPAQLNEEKQAEVISLDLADLADLLILDTPNMKAHVEELDRRVGPLPLSLRAWYEEVGAVNFYGHHPTWGRFADHPDRYLMSFCDPLHVCVLDDKLMHELLHQHERGGLFLFEFAPDPYFKDYTAGSSTPFALRVAHGGADDTLDSYEAGLTFVQYLRRCLKWAGFPGMEAWDRRPEEDLAFLTQGLLPI